MLEGLSRRGLIDLYFDDERHFCSQGYVPRGWQFADEQVSISSYFYLNPNVKYQYARV